MAALDFTPKLTFVRVGEDPASAYYVRSKERLAAKVGIASETRVLPEGTGQAELLALVEGLNADQEVDGILVQLPAPGIDEAAVLNAIDPAKDVDGLHPVNVGRLWSGRPGLRPATPSGVLALADRYDVPLSGARAVVVGRSNLVGKPVAGMLLARDATVTLAHSRTRDLADVTREADVLVAAVGRPGLVTSDMVKPGAAVFDVGFTSGIGERERLGVAVDPDGPGLRAGAQHRLGVAAHAERAVHEDRPRPGQRGGEQLDAAVQHDRHVPVRGRGRACGHGSCPR